MTAHSVQFGAGQWRKLRDFIDERFGEGFANADFVFRGEAECYPSVLAAIDRLLPQNGTPSGAAGRLVAELTAMHRFRQHAAMHLDSMQRQMLNEGMQSQVVMRHYGAPTRLLDWTESPWIALHFACEDAARSGSRGCKLGRILAFDRTVLEKVIARDYGDEAPAHAQLVPNSSDYSVPRLLTSGFAESARDWVVCYHRHAEKFPRLIAQQGLFTFASKPWVDHWDMVQRLCPEHHIEIQIEPSLKPEIMRRLSRMGLTAVALFPDIEGVAREVTAQAALYFTP